MVVHYGPYQAVHVDITDMLTAKQGLAVAHWDLPPPHPQNSNNYCYVIM